MPFLVQKEQLFKTETWCLKHSYPDRNLSYRNTKRKKINRKKKKINSSFYYLPDTGFQHFTCYVILTTILSGKYYYYPHFTDEETKTQS